MTSTLSVSVKVCQVLNASMCDFAFSCFLQSQRKPCVLLYNRQGQQNSFFRDSLAQSRFSFVYYFDWYPQPLFFNEWPRSGIGRCPTRIFFFMMFRAEKSFLSSSKTRSVCTEFEELELVDAIDKLSSEDY